MIFIRVLSIYLVDAIDWIFAFIELYVEWIAVESENPGDVLEVIVGGIFDVLYESDFLSFIGRI